MSAAKETEKTSPVQKIKTIMAERKSNRKANKKIREDHSSLWGKIGFVLGLVSVVAWLSPLIGVIVTTAGLVFNILGLRVDRGRWFAVTGLTLSIIFLNLSFIYGFYNLLISMLGA